MTGYGLSSLETETVSVSVEIKCLNSKFLDVNLKIPKEYTEKELEVRNILGNTIERGKIGLAIEVDEKGETSPKVTLNRSLVAQYYKDLKETASLVGASETELFKLALQMPKALNTDTENEDINKVWEVILKTLNDALKKCEDFRLNEGKILGKKLEDYILKID